VGRPKVTAGIDKTDEPTMRVSTCACAIVKTALLPALFDSEEEDKTWSLADLCLLAA
jgi:hypothetical protein